MNFETRCSNPLTTSRLIGRELESLLTLNFRVLNSLSIFDWLYKGGGSGNPTRRGGEKNRTSSHKQMHRCLNVLSHTPFLLLSFLPIRLIHTIHYSAENFPLPSPKWGSEGRKETPQRTLNSPYRHSKKMTPKRNEEGMQIVQIPLKSCYVVRKVAWRISSFYDILTPIFSICYVLL